MRSTPNSLPRRWVELDWVVVSLAGIRRWGLLVFFIFLAGGVAGGVYYFLHEPVQVRALRTLQRATALQQDVRRTGISESLSAEFEKASHLLDDARSDWERKDYPACLARAQDALQQFEAINGLLNRDFVGSGQIIALQGDVEVQRANQSGWNRAREKQALYNGDFVKTATDASAEVLFSDGTVYRIGPDSLLEVHREARTGRDASSGEVKVKIGQVNVYTAVNPSTVVTEAARAEVEHDSRVGVEVADDSATTVATYSGRAEVTGAGGDRVALGTRQAVSAAPGGALSERLVVPEAPALERPAANALVNLDETRRVELDWRPVPGSTGYELQLSRSRLFAASNLEFTNRRAGNAAVLKVIKPGTYYWRVATLGSGRLRSEWSSPRSFRALERQGVEALGDSTPPRLEVQRPTQIGNFFLVQGVTEPGVTVTINAEPVEVASDGTFRKAVALNHEGWNTIVTRATDPFGNTSEDRKSVFVEAE
jgi:uncharacterized membrane protein